MKKVTPLVLLLFSTMQILFAQQGDLDAILINMMGSRQTCESVSNRCATLFVNCYKSDRIDLIPQLLEYWQEKCGVTEPVQRAKTLYAIDQNSYRDFVIGYGIMDLVLNYQNRVINEGNENEVERYENNKQYFSYVPIGGEFDNFTKSLAARNKAKYQQNSIEYAWCEFYSTAPDMLFTYVQKNRYSDSKLTYQYREKVREVKKMINWNWAISAGGWIPAGEMSALGVHPEVGILFGGKGGRISLDFDASIRFLNSQSKYLVTQGTNTYETNRFFGAYIGLDFGWDFYAKKENSFAVLAGLGWDGFEAKAEDMRRSQDAILASSYNFNFGVGYRRNISNSLYLSLHLKCNIVDYTMENVVDYRGVPITLKLIFGYQNNPMKQSILKRLKYDR